MTVLNFPSTVGQPTDGSFTYTENGVIYTWNGSYWAANNADNLDSRYVNVGGDTMTGDLTVPNLISEGDVQTTSLNGGQLAGFRNQLINGDFRVWQRGEDLTITGSQQAYGPDRWFFRANSSVGATSTEAKLVQDGPTSKCRIVFNGTPTGPGYIQQRIETQSIQGLYGKELTLSFYLENVSMSSAPVPTLSITAYGSGGSSTQLVDSNNAITSLGNNKYSVTFTYTTSDGTVNDATGFGMSIGIFINGQSPVSSGACQVWGCQLEEGPVATPFEHRPIGTELALCQRYFFYTDRGYNMFSYKDNDNRYLYLFLPVEMRANPTTSFVDSSYLSSPTVVGYTTYLGLEGTSTDTTRGSGIGKISADAEL